MIDDVAFEACEPDGRLGFLLGLLAKEPVRAYRYADEGPPAHLPRKRHPYVQTEVVDGWITEAQPNESGIRGVVYADGESIADWTMHWHDSLGVLIANTKPPASYQTEIDPVARMRADCIAVLSAEAMDADIFITDRDFLFECPFRLSRTVAVMRPSEALPVIGLYLRQQGEYIVHRTIDGSGTSGFGPGLFYWVAARELLPAAWRWMTACVQHSLDVGNDRLIYLSSSLIQRVDRALRARDRLLVALCRPQVNNSATDALVELDQVCLFLMSAMDIAACVAHLTLGLGGQLRDATWQNRDWWREVNDLRPSLATLMRDGSNGAELLKVLRALRNTIHGEALSALAIKGVGQQRKNLVRLPREDRKMFLHAVDRLGGRRLWGIEELGSEDIYAHPGDFIGQLFPRVIELANDLLTQTPVERLTGVTIRPDDFLPPIEPPFDLRSRERVRWQLGF